VLRLAHDVNDPWSRGLGEVYLSPIDVILSRITVLQPDLVCVERERLGIVTERAIEGAPTLVVEVLSPSTDARDRGVKQALYARYGVPFYWIADPVARRLQALRWSGASWEVAGALDETTPAALPPLTDLTLDPTAVWR
jgi:Uma2 family endonuclease